MDPVNEVNRSEGVEHTPVIGDQEFWVEIAAGLQALRSLTEYSQKIIPTDSREDLDDMDPYTLVDRESAQAQHEAYRCALNCYEKLALVLQEVVADTPLSQSQRERLHEAFEHIEGIRPHWEQLYEWSGPLLTSGRANGDHVIDIAEALMDGVKSLHAGSVRSANIALSAAGEFCQEIYRHEVREWHYPSVEMIPNMEVLPEEIDITIRDATSALNDISLSSKSE